jgi:hypothetical protein
MLENPRSRYNFCVIPRSLPRLQPHFAKIQMVKRPAVELITTIHSAGGEAVAAAARAKRNDRLRQRIAAQQNGAPPARQSSFNATTNSLFAGNTKAKPIAKPTANRLIL